MFCKIAVIRDFAILTRKELYWSLFLVKLQTAAFETHLINTKLFIKILFVKHAFREIFDFLTKFIHKEKCGRVKK